MNATVTHRRERSTTDSSILPSASAPPVEIPPGHVGPVFLPKSGRMIWWTGRVAIGLRHEPARRREQTSQSAMWLQDLMLSRRPMLRTA